MCKVGMVYENWEQPLLYIYDNSHSDLVGDFNTEGNIIFQHLGYIHKNIEGDIIF